MTTKRQQVDVVASERNKRTNSKKKGGMDHGEKRELVFEKNGA